MRAQFIYVPWDHGHGLANNVNASISSKHSTSHSVRKAAKKKVLFLVAPSSLVAKLFVFEEIQKKLFFLSGQAVPPPPPP